MDETVTCLVRGPASRYPRGFVWLIPVWSGVLATVILVVGKHADGGLPVWLGATELGSLAIATVTIFSVLMTVRQRAFRADGHGVWLGCSSKRRRPRLRQIHLAWPDIAQLRIEPRRYGALLEITLSPAARISHRPGLIRQVLLLAGALLLPFAFGRGLPALTTPTTDPPRYRLKICDRTAADLRQALAAVRPDGVQVRVLTKKRALRFAVPAARQPVSQQPPTPVV